MILLHQIGDRKHGSNFNTLEEILACDEELSFDGIYESVYRHYKQLKGKKITFFVMGKYVGGDNSFDLGQPFSRYCTWEQIREMAEYLGAEIGYHSWSHPDLTTLDDLHAKAEIQPPFPMKRFAYPGGTVNDRIAHLVAAAGYEDAWSVVQGNGDRYQRLRRYLNW